MNKKGFTLVEVLVAVFVISIALGGAFTAAQISLRYSIASQNRVVAFYLAQEGFELIKNVRDGNFQENLNYWLEYIDVCEDETCRISAFPYLNDTWRTIGPCTPGSGDCLLRMSDDGRIWHTTSLSVTPFERYFTIEKTIDDEIRVDMTIAWTQGSNDYTFETTEYISNWRGDHTDPQ